MKQEFFRIQQIDRMIFLFECLVMTGFRKRSALGQRQIRNGQGEWLISGREN